jgi:arginase family enzyme
MYGPDATFLGVPRADLDDESSFAGAGAVIIGAPFDGGTSHRPGCRFGPQAIRLTDYLPHDGSRPHLALGVDPLVELGVVDVGDVIMPPGETELGSRAPRGSCGEDLGGRARYRSSSGATTRSRFPT